MTLTGFYYFCTNGKAKCAQIYMSPHRDTAMHTSNFATNQMGIYTSQQ